MDNTEEKNVYKKVGRKYVPLGLRIEDNLLSDGIWIVRHKEHSKQMTNAGYLAHICGLCKVGDNAVADFTQLASIEEYADVVSKVMVENDNKSISRYDLACIIVKRLFAHFRRFFFLECDYVEL